jgi:hypothetical protein
MVSAGALVSVMAAVDVFGFGFEWRRPGFVLLVFAGAIVVDELEFCAETISPMLANAATAAITTTRTKGKVVLFLTVVLLCCRLREKRRQKASAFSDSR